MLTNLVEGWKGQQRTYKCCLHAAKAPIRRNKKPKPLVASGTPFQLVDGNLAFSDSALPPAKQGHPACLRRPVAQQSTFAPQGCRPTPAGPGPLTSPSPKPEGKNGRTNPRRHVAPPPAGERVSESHVPARAPGPAPRAPARRHAPAPLAPPSAPGGSGPREGRRQVRALPWSVEGPPLARRPSRRPALLSGASPFLTGMAVLTLTTVRHYVYTWSSQDTRGRHCCYQPHSRGEPADHRG